MTSSRAAFDRANALRQEAARLLSEAKAIEAAAIVPMTYQDWWDGLAARKKKEFAATMPVRTYDDARGIDHKANVVYYENLTFKDGETPYFMRGSRVVMTKGFDNVWGKEYVSRIANAYIAKIAMPTIFRREEWYEYSSSLRRRIKDKVGIGARWRTQPDVNPGLVADEAIGVDRGWHRRYFVLRGRVIDIMANARELRGVDYQEECNRRADMIMEMVRSVEKIERLEKRLAA